MKLIQPGPVKGTIQAPTSKSVMQRAVALASLSSSPTTIYHPSLCEDGVASLEIAKALGAKIIQSNEDISISPYNTVSEIFPCNESGTSFRIFCAIAAMYDKPITLTATGSLQKRPMKMVTDFLRKNGVYVESQDDLPPLTIIGPLSGGTYAVDGSESSQFLSGLLIALPLAKTNSTISVSNLKSKPYVELTLEMIEKFGGKVLYEESLSSFEIPGNQSYQGTNISIEGDWSGAAFPLVLGAINGSVTVNNLSIQSKQGDKAIIEVLKQTGAEVSINFNTITVSKSDLVSFEFDATHTPDLFPPLAALASCCRGESIIKGVKRLFTKESNRAHALLEEFKKLGILISLDDDLMKIIGGSLEGAEINSHNDHRIAMACAVAATCANAPVMINNPECVNKSYPQFFDHLYSLQGVS